MAEVTARRTHDYTCHGTTSLFAALELASGKVHARCYRRHRHTEFIAFLKLLAGRYPRRELHLICDNYETREHPAVKVAGRPSAHPPPFHADWRLVAQPSRALGWR